MPSWNIHTAHVERLLGEHDARELGIEDANTFLFGNFVPDIYVGFMVPGVSFHIDYCITHVADVELIPVPDADLFWDRYVAYRFPSSAEGRSLVLGAWAHILADRFYNGSFRTFWEALNQPPGDDQRVMKQADFDLFGRSLPIESLVTETPGLLRAAHDFVPYRILADDVRRAIDVANTITIENATVPPRCDHYQLLDAAWMQGVFAACHERLATWLLTWRDFERAGRRPLSADIRAAAGLPPATPDRPR